MKNENAYQGELIKKIKKRFPGCFVLKNDPNYLQGVPDISIFYKDRWAMLEVKKSATESFRPNQEYYVELLDSMSFSRVIFPENEEEVLNELQRSFES